MLLKNLIKSCPKHLRFIKVGGLTSDSRNLKKGEIFFAIDGQNYKGSNFVDAALKKGASAIITSSKVKKNVSKIIKVENVKETLVRCCKKYYSKKPRKIIAVTGTNGKSSVADFFHQILSLNKIPVATIGTLGIKINKKFYKTNLTTLDTISLHKKLSEIKKSKIDNVLMEISSHGLKQGRAEGISFISGIFTNLSRDHLDYHKSMKNYFDAKMILFKKILTSKSTMITDENLKCFAKLKKISTKKNFKLKTINIEKNENLLSDFKLIGKFQKKNLLMSILACETIGIKKKNIFNKLNRIISLRGRLELIKKFPNNTKVFVDFAHTPEALKTAIETLKNFYKKDVTLIFGCGGERDKAKRSTMGRIANKLCNKIYVTDDNPRNENPKKIRNKIVKSIDKKKVKEIGNRAKAIKHAVLNSKHNEIILVAGKGHEEFQDYGNKIYKISDKKIIKQIKLKKKTISQINKRIKYNQLILNRLIKNKINRSFLGVSINSKKLKKRNLFIAIKGKKLDGHNYVKESIFKGAASCVVSNKFNFDLSKKIIKTKNTNEFLNKLAHLKRLSSEATIIGITGSSGKTSLKDLIGKLLSFFEKTYYSQKSFNNSYGVPLSLSNLELDHKYGVFEIGMSKSGEIDKLSKLVKPHIAVITNIAEAHIENFKDLKGIAKAKGEIINNIVKDGYLILNRDDNFFSYFKNEALKKNIKVVSFGLNKNSDIKALRIKKINSINYLTVKVFNKIYNLNFEGHHINNILGLIAVLKVLNLDIQSFIKKIDDIEMSDGRGKTYKIKLNNIKFNLIDESYNANPLSMRESISKISKIKDVKSSKYLLLGDMLELGKKSHNFHKKLSKAINKSDIKKLFVHGKLIMDTYKNVKQKKRGNILQQNSDFNETILPILKKNDYLLIKGSNATGLHEISKKLIKGRPNAL